MGMVSVKPLFTVNWLVGSHRFPGNPNPSSPSDQQAEQPACAQPGAGFCKPSSFRVPAYFAAGPEDVMPPKSTPPSLSWRERFMQILPVDRDGYLSDTQAKELLTLLARYEGQYDLDTLIMQIRSLYFSLTTRDWDDRHKIVKFLFAEYDPVITETMEAVSVLAKRKASTDIYLKILAVLFAETGKSRINTIHAVADSHKYDSFYLSENNLLRALEIVFSGNDSDRAATIASLNQYVESLKETHYLKDEEIMALLERYLLDYLRRGDQHTLEHFLNVGQMLSKHSIFYSQARFHFAIRLFEAPKPPEFFKRIDNVLTSLVNQEGYRYDPQKMGAILLLLFEALLTHPQDWLERTWTDESGISDKIWEDLRSFALELWREPSRGNNASEFSLDGRPIHYVRPMTAEMRRVLLAKGARLKLSLQDDTLGIKVTFGAAKSKALTIVSQNVARLKILTEKGLEPLDTFEIRPGSVIQIGRAAPMRITDPLQDLEKGIMPDVATAPDLAESLVDLSAQLREKLMDVSTIGDPKDVMLDIQKHTIKTVEKPAARASQALRLRHDGTKVILTRPSDFSLPIYRISGDLMFLHRENDELRSGDILIVETLRFQIPEVPELVKKTSTMILYLKKLTEDSALVRKITTKMTDGHKVLEIGHEQLRKEEPLYVDGSHARLSWHTKSYRLADLGSGVGTYYRRQQQTEEMPFYRVPQKGIRLQPGDWVLIGNIAFQLPEIRQKKAAEPDDTITALLTGDEANAYRTLGLRPGRRYADSTIKRRRRKLSREHHPDRFPEGTPERSEATDRQKEINVAADLLLKDKDKKKKKKR